MSFHVREFGSELYIINELNWVPYFHIHNHVEIVYLTSGSFTAILDNTTYTVRAGDLLFVFPHQIHYYHATEKIEGYICVFTPNLHPKLKSVFRKKTPTHPILHHEQLPTDIACSLRKTFENYRREEFYSTLVSDAYLLKILGEIMPIFTYKENTSDHDTVKQILIHCIENYTEPISLETLSQKFNLSQTYISRLFHDRLHTSYIDFINKIRVGHACQQLEKGCNITEIAFSSGFSSISTFNRAFLKHMGTSPREYIKSKH